MSYPFAWKNTIIFFLLMPGINKQGIDYFSETLGRDYWVTTEWGDLNRCLTAVFWMEGSFFFY